MVGRRGPHPQGPEPSPPFWDALRLRDMPRPRTGTEILRLAGTRRDHRITTIDHADIREGRRVEAAVGATLAERPDLRSRLDPITRRGVGLTAGDRPGQRVVRYDSLAAHSRASVQRSLRALRAETIDAPPPPCPDPPVDADEAAGALEAPARDGLMRCVAVPNDGPPLPARLRDGLSASRVTYRIAAAPVRPAALGRGTPDEAQRLGMRPTGRAPLGGGRIFQRATPLASVGGGSRFARPRRCSARRSDAAGERAASGDRDHEGRAPAPSRRGGRRQARDAGPVRALRGRPGAVGGPSRGARRYAEKRRSGVFRSRRPAESDARDVAQDVCSTFTVTGRLNFAGAAPEAGLPSRVGASSVCGPQRLERDRCRILSMTRCWRP